MLLLHRRPERGDFWQPITGSIEEGETPLDTARREIVEETGIRAEPEEIGLTQSFMIESQFLSSKHSGPIIASEIAFRTTIDSSLSIRLDREEHDAWDWFPFADAYKKIRWTDDREALELLESRIR